MTHWGSIVKVSLGSFRAILDAPFSASVSYGNTSVVFQRGPCLDPRLLFFFLQREQRGGQGLCAGLEVSLLEVIGVGLITCEGVGVVKRVHTLFGGVHKLATAPKEVEEVQEEVQEIRDEWEDEEVEENGGQKVEEKRSSHAWMR